MNLLIYLFGFDPDKSAVFEGKVRRIFLFVYLFRVPELPLIRLIDDSFYFSFFPTTEHSFA